MKTGRIALVFSMVIFSLVTLGQEVRFSFQMGAAIPVWDFALKSATPDSGGYASTGFDVRFVGEREFENNIVAGFNLGYSVYGLDKEGMENALDPCNCKDLNIQTQSFQNLNLQGRIGYSIEIIKDKFGVVPFVDAGLGVFNSAYYVVQYPNGDEFVRSGNTAVNFLLSPGLDIWIPLNNFMNLKLYGSYQFAKYNVDETFTATYTDPGSTNEVSKNTVNYEYNSINTGLGITLVF